MGKAVIKCCCTRKCQQGSWVKHVKTESREFSKTKASTKLWALETYGY